MTPAQIFANPSLMMLVCLIGGALRDGMSRDLLTKLMLIGTFVPELGMAIKGSMVLQERLGDDAPWFHEDDPVDESGNPCSGWIRQEDHGWVWRIVTKAVTMIIAFAVILPSRNPTRRRPRRGGGLPRLVLAALSQKRFLIPVLAGSPNCALIVPVS